MTLIVDTGPLVSAFARSDPRMPAVAGILMREPGDIVLPAPISAEVDYLAGARLGRRARQAFLTDLANGRFDVACPLLMEYELILQLDRQYADLDVGLADLSVVVLARRFGTRRILTFDERHFRALRPLDGGTFTLLPADDARSSR